MSMGAMVKNVLITGASGFLGRHVAREFIKTGWRVIGIDTASPENAGLPFGADYHKMQLPSAALGKLIESERPDVCIHCAGRASVPFSVEDPAADFASNTALTFEILDSLRLRAPACRFVFLSSAAVYGNVSSLPVSEHHATRPLSPYGYHKLQSELLCEEFHRVFGIPTASARIFSAYGAGLRRQVVWDICSKLLLGKGEIRLIGTGNESRDFIHASDVARALALLARAAPCEGERYNLGSGEETTISTLVELIKDAIGREARVTFSGEIRKGDPANWCADIQRVRELGFSPAVSLEEGLRGVAKVALAELGGG